MPIRLTRPRSELQKLVDEYKARSALPRLFEQCSDDISRPTFDRYVSDNSFITKKDSDLNKAQKRFIFSLGKAASLKELDAINHYKEIVRFIGIEVSDIGRIDDINGLFSIYRDNSNNRIGTIIIISDSEKPYAIFDLRIKIDGKQLKFDGMILPSGKSILIAAIDKIGNIFGNFITEKSVARNPLCGTFIIGIPGQSAMSINNIAFVFQRSLDGKGVDDEDRAESISKLDEMCSK
jgi:hypothetical protein